MFLNTPWSEEWTQRLSHYVICGDETGQKYPIKAVFKRFVLSIAKDTSSVSRSNCIHWNQQITTYKIWSIHTSDLMKTACWTVILSHTAYWQILSIFLLKQLSLRRGQLHTVTFGLEEPPPHIHTHIMYKLMLQIMVLFIISFNLTIQTKQKYQVLRAQGYTFKGKEYFGKYAHLFSLLRVRWEGWCHSCICTLNMKPMSAAD